MLQIHNSKIVSSNRFTDTKMAMLAIASALIFITFCLISPIPGPIKNIYKLDTDNFKLEMFGLALILLGVYIIPLFVIVLYNIFPTAMIYINCAISLIMAAASVMLSISVNNLGSAFSALLLFMAMVFFVYRIIKARRIVRKLIKIATNIILLNIQAYTAACISCILTTAICVYTATLLLSYCFTPQGSNEMILIKVLYAIMSCVLMVIYVGNCIVVFYAKVAHQHMLNLANPKEYTRNTLVAGVTRVILSTGTIFIASLLKFVISLTRYLTKRSYNNNRRAGGGLFVSFILFIVLLVISLLELLVEELNSYCLVYNALFGTKFSHSMKHAFHEFKKYVVSCYLNMASICIIPMMVFASSAMVYNMHYITRLFSVYSLHAQNYNGLGLVWGIYAVALGGSLMTVPMVRGILIAVYFIQHADTELVEKAYPKYIIKEGAVF
ncbi:uncharacterized protein NESG_01246 [Nematocida ausubeli]|uniref:Protein PNS1 n=1 Tax=Nematocida ausubeli (strain ATCC PRA-371 / ERTm2) TaxID=1913371 RepID=A0A086J1W3_NEMA1|nr:uncharacterized protein NESG_01246 [Nematocida ausubeli]KAI5136306.1 hypothetical protein NEAUS06_1851 [Nematocida ausubeli]KFG26131.1 hypothetical protein NESG_01246 [Nematocida ausubeli]